MNDLNTALEIIQNYIDECLFEPKINWPEYEFDKRSSERWAANELMLYLMQHWDEAPVTSLIIRFMGRMDVFSEVKEDTPPSYRFIIARDTVEDILYLFV